MTDTDKIKELEQKVRDLEAAKETAERNKEIIHQRFTKYYQKVQVCLKQTGKTQQDIIDEALKIPHT